MVIFSESFRYTQRTALCSDNSAPLAASEQSCDDDNIVCINGVWNAVKLIQIMQSTFLFTVWTCAVCFVFVFVVVFNILRHGHELIMFSSSCDYILFIQRMRCNIEIKQFY